MVDTPDDRYDELKDEDEKKGEENNLELLEEDVHRTNDDKEKDRNNKN